MYGTCSTNVLDGPNYLLFIILNKKFVLKLIFLFLPLKVDSESKQWLYLCLFFILSITVNFVEQSLLICSSSSGNFLLKTHRLIFNSCLLGFINCLSKFLFFLLLNYNGSVLFFKTLSFKMNLFWSSEVQRVSERSLSYVVLYPYLYFTLPHHPHYLRGDSLM